jgi:hypothetical protein
VTKSMPRVGESIRSERLRLAEKAGVGGSTPSLATIILKDLRRIHSLSAVRSQSALSPLPSASVLWLRIAVSIFSGATMRSQLTTLEEISLAASPSLGSIYESRGIQLTPNRPWYPYESMVSGVVQRDLLLVVETRSFSS